MLETYEDIIKNYSKQSPKFNKVEWSDLPDSTKLKLIKFPEDVKKLGNFVTVRRLKQSQHLENISESIIGIKKEMTGNKSFRIKFPIYLNNEAYAGLYALMVSEGSYRTEYSLNVPEDEFHDLFKYYIKTLISKEAASLIKTDYNGGFLRSRAPASIRYIIPLPPIIPCVILDDGELAREYLRVAFEAEGSPILNIKQHKRYIKLSRYVDISDLAMNEKIPLIKRIYLSEIRKKFPSLFDKVVKRPPMLLRGEQILLKKHFNIDSNLVCEAIRKNKTDLRCGKITARWVLLIYADNIDKFVTNVGFLSEKKKEITAKMNSFRSNRPQYSTLKTIFVIADKNKCFSRKQFIKEMTKKDYKSPSAYLWRYERKKLIKRVGRGQYKLLIN